MEREAFLFFFIIFCTLHHQVLAGCAHIESYELKIPDNPVIIGKKFGPNWYEKVQWRKRPSDEMVLSYDAQFWSDPAFSTHRWKHDRNGEIGLCDMTDKGEAGDIAKIVRQMLGLPVGCNVSPGKKKTDPDFFGPSKPCRQIGYDWRLGEKKQRYLMSLVYRDKQLLSGQIVIPAKPISSCDDHEYRLTKHLLEGYDAGVRPAKNSSQPLVVIFGLSLHHIIDVDEKNQILTTNCWVTQIWTDHHLKWNISDYAGIRVIRVPYNRVWRPDTILYNNADPQYSSAVINTNVIVSHTGEVVWLSHGIFRSSCNIDVEFFPFDEQRCALKWASWTYDGYQLELERQSEAGDVSNYQANGEFDLVDFTAQRNIEFYSCCPEPYPDITYEIRLRRRPMFYVFNLILPCILINGIALLVFYVPSESGEKVTLGISALLSMTVFLMTIRETLPPTEKTPLISLYYGVSICLVSFASGLAVVTLNLHHRGVRGAGVPAVIKSLVLTKLGKILFFNFKEKEPSPTTYREPTDSTRRRQTCPLHCSMELQQTSPKIVPRRSESHNSNNSSPSLGAEGSLELHWSRILTRVHTTIERNERRLTEQDRREQAELEWKQVALVSDRALLCVFFLTTAISTAVILCGAPPVDAPKKG